jgi:anti-anti-sigma regulatory factor
MSNYCQTSDASLRLKFVGQMTYDNYREIEDRIADALKCRQPLQIDLAEVSEIDLCGLHLIGILQSEGVIVAVSPIVEQASQHLLTTLQSAALGRATRKTHEAFCRVGN